MSKKTDFYKKIIALSGFLFCITIISSAQSDTIYVNDNAAGADTTGESWATAYCNLQRAFDSALAGDVIWVAEGTYFPSKDINGVEDPADERTLTFQLPAGITLLGGFNGTETSDTLRDPLNNQTVLTPSSIVYHVVRGANNTTIDGFHIANGYAFLSPGITKGGGILNDNVSNFIIKNCMFTNNYSNSGGGGIANINSTVTIEDCTFEYNKDYESIGGAIYNNDNGNVEITGCIFNNNEAKQGGAIANDYCNYTAIIHDCIFTHNSAGNGSVIANFDTRSTITECVFAHNECIEVPSLQNRGGAIYNWGDESDATIDKCTFYNNSGESCSGVVNWAWGISTTITNSLFHNVGNNDILNGNWANATVFYCRITQNNYEGSNNNIPDLPMIYDFCNGDIRLNVSSPCIDAGDPTHEPDPDETTTDIGATHDYYDPADDALITKLFYPETFGQDTVKATLNNYGQNTITSVPVHWSVDGIEQPVLNWTGSLAKNGKDSALVLGTYDFTFGEHTIDVWTALPGDDYTGNDHYTLDIISKSNKDIGVYSIEQPADGSVIPAGSTDIAVSIMNLSSDSTITGAALQWEVDGIRQPDTTWSGNLGHGQTSYPFIFGNYDFTPGMHSLKVWTARPDSSWDDNHNNDTSTISFTAYTYDIGVARILKPNEICNTGTNALDVTVANYSGDSTITTFTLEWQVNGGTIYDSACTAEILPGNTSGVITLDSINLSSGENTITVWTSLPNGQPDEITSNDQAEKQVSACNPLMEQTFTIGNDTTDFKTFAEAIDTLTSSCGIAGAITFAIIPGTYYEQFVIPDIPGASKNCPIIFKPWDDDSTSVIITDTTATDTTNYVIKLDGADGIVFKDITLANPDKEYSTIIALTAGSTENEIRNNHFIGSGGNGQLIKAGGDSIFTNVFIDNLFEYGLDAIEINGNYSHRGKGNIISGNSFYQQARHAVSIGYQKDAVITDNIIVSDSFNVSAIALNNYITETLTITNNKIWLTNYATGIYIHYYQGDYNKRANVSNNFIALGAPYNSCFGIRLSVCEYLDIVHNSINMTGDNHKNTGISLSGNYNRILNNNIGLFKQGNPVSGYNASNVFDYNNLFVENGSFSLDDLINNYGQCENCISVYPRFLSNSNLHTTNPMINDKGVYIAGVDYDIDGEIRDHNTPDIGADEFTPCTPLSGEYTVGASGADFNTINEAVDRLVSCGVSGPVTFNIQSGNYMEQIEIGHVPFSSEENNVTFKSESGDSTDVIITNIGNEEKNYTLLINASHITFRGLTLMAMNEDYCRVVEIKERNYDINFLNNRLEGPAITNDNDKENKAVIYGYDDYSNSENISYVRFENNLLINGSYGIFLYGSSSQKLENIDIVSNSFTNQNANVIHVAYINSMYAGMNRIEIMNDRLAGLYLYSNSSNNTVERNNIIFKGNDSYRTTGIQFYSYTWDQINSSAIINNSVKGVELGINIKDAENINVCYNTIDADHGINLSGTNDTLMNNIFKCADLEYNEYVMNYEGENMYIDYNNYYVPGEDNAIIFTGKYGTVPFAAWQDSSGLDAHSISYDPELSGSPLHTASPQLNNKGASFAGIHYDIDGESRDPATPDIGADEYGFTLGIDKYRCPGDTIILYAGDSYDSYQWSDQASTDSIIVYYDDVGMGSATYSVTVSSGGTDYSDEITVNYVRPRLSVMEDTGICKYSSVTLHAASPDAVRYEWEGAAYYDSSAFSAYTNEDETFFTVKVFDSLGCSTTDSILVTGYDIPNAPTIQLTNNNRLSIDNNSDQVTWYQWYCNTEVLSDTASIITPQTTGFYQAKAYNHTCPSPISGSVYVSYVSILDINEIDEDIIIYPNPAMDHVYIDPGNNTGLEKVQIFSSNGMMITSKNIENSAPVRIDVSGYTPGEYILRVTDTKGESIEKILVIY